MLYATAGRCWWLCACGRRLGEVTPAALLVLAVTSTRRGQRHQRIVYRIARPVTGTVEADCACGRRHRLAETILAEADHVAA